MMDDVGNGVVIATRELTLRGDEGNIPIPIRVFAPKESEPHGWVCHFEIDWPEGKVTRWAAGYDSVQALVFVLQMIGAEIYGRDEHKSGNLMWLEPDTGYGFPVMNIIRDLLVGADKRYL
jgi:hypothetical protein